MTDMTTSDRSRLDAALLADDPAAALRAGRAAGWLDALIPELGAEMDFPQLTRFHIHTIWEHSIRTCAAMPATVDLRLLGLFHDIGKRRVMTINDKTGQEQYLGHAVVGARLTWPILHRLGYEPALVETICRQIAHHMDLHMAANNGQSAKAQAKLLDKIAPDLDVLKWLQLADIAAMHPDLVAAKSAEALAYHDLLDETIAEAGGEW